MAPRKNKKKAEKQKKEPKLTEKRIREIVKEEILKWQSKQHPKRP